MLSPLVINVVTVCLCQDVVQHCLSARGLQEVVKISGKVCVEAEGSYSGGGAVIQFKTAKARLLFFSGKLGGGAEHVGWRGG